MSAPQYIRSRDVERRASRWKRLQWHLEALAWDLLYWWPLSQLSPERASNLGGQVAKTLGPYLSQHNVALANIRRAFPEYDEEEVTAIATAAWDNLGRLAGELPHLAAIDPYGPGGRVDVIGTEHLDAVEASAQGAVLVSGHFANWEIMAAAICNRPVDCLVTYRAINNPHIDRRLNAIRHRYGIGVLTPKGLGTRQLMAALKAGRCVALLNDQKFREGIAVPFFGHAAMTAPGPSRLARRYNVPILFLTTRRTGPAKFSVTVHPPITPVRTGNEAADIHHMVSDITHRIEAEIRANPGQWFWMHKRWPKSPPAGEKAISTSFDKSRNLR